MLRLIKQFLAEFRYGAAQVLIISSRRDYILPAEKSFRIDAANLNKDARRLGIDLNKNLKRQNSNGNSANRR